jgi:Ca2+/Na+ antiporter
VRRTEFIFAIEIFFAMSFFMLMGMLPLVSGALLVSCLLSFVFAGFVLACANEDARENSFGYLWSYVHHLRPRQASIQFLDPLLI